MKDLYDKVSVVVEQLRIKDLSQIDQTLPPLEECYNQMIAFLKES